MLSRLEFRLQTCPSANTGGWLWSSGHHLSKWLFACRTSLAGRSILELGCGLGLPSLVATHFAERVVATDYEPPLLETLCANAVSHGIIASASAFSAATGFSTAILDFTSASNLVAAGLGAWDMVLFTDCIFNAQTGEALPHALSALLRPGGIAVGVFPAQERPGVARFWHAVAKAGLRWYEADTESRDRQDCSMNHLYIFQNRSRDKDDTAEQLTSIIGEPEDEVADVEPLFSDI